MFRLTAKVISAVTVLCLFFCGFASAESANFEATNGGDSANLSSVEVLTWEECVREALQNQPQLIAAQQKLGEARASKAITTSAILPQITGNAGASRGKSATSATSNNYDYSVTGNQLLFDGFKTAFDISSAQKTVNAARFNFDVVSSDVRLALRNAYAELLGAQESVKVTEDIIKRRKYNLGLVRLRYQGGREHKGSLMTAEADVAKAQLQFEVANSSLLRAQQKLVKAMGRRFFSPVRATGNFSVSDFPSRQPDFYKVADSNPFLKERIAQREAADMSLKAAKASYLPQVTASAGYGQANSSWPPNKSQWVAGLDLSVPIFQGGLTKAQVDKARAALEQAKAVERSGKDEIIVNLTDTWSRLKDAIQNVNVQRQYLEATQTRAKIADAQYSNGLILFDNWIIIEDNLVNAKTAYINSQIAALEAEAAWVQAKGGTLEYDSDKK